MLIRGKRLVPFVGPLLLVLIIIGLGFYDKRFLAWPFHSSWSGDAFSVNTPGAHSDPSQDGLSISIPVPIPPSNNDGSPGAITQPDTDMGMSATHREVFSVSTPDRKYFAIEFGQQKALNPSIIPHPTLNETWIIVAQKHQNGAVAHSVWSAELVCDAVFQDDVLRCVDPPFILPIAATAGEGDSSCIGDLGPLALSIGPHDARVFYGPKSPYAIYGSNSLYTCFGQWMLDFRLLVDWGFEIFAPNEFRRATELQRPAPWGLVEKNWFVFWDASEQIYVHYNVAPKRAFAKLEYDGSVGADLAPLAALHDEACLAKYMPSVATEQESIHQATNSLSVTLCRRADPFCEPDDSNTFILTIFQHKSFYAFHSVYEPYVMLFRRTAPFEIHGISTKPLWIHGRGAPGTGKKPDAAQEEDEGGWDQTEMMYVSSVSWKTQGQRYYGYVDDVLFVAFGVEDERTAGIDVLAGGLLGDLGICGAV